MVTNPTTTSATVQLVLGHSSTTKVIDNTQPGNFSIEFTDYFGSQYYRNIESPKTVRITSSGDVSVIAHYSYNQRYSSWYSTGTMILPVTSLGTDHYIISYRPDSNAMSEFTVTAVELTTTVSIRASDGYRNVKVLQPYETYEYRSLHDLTGSRITSDNPVSVLAGVSNAKVPDGINYAAYLAVQMPGVDSVGMNYILSPFRERNSGYIYRVVATQDNTMITVSLNEASEFHAGEMLEDSVSGENVTMITATKPIYVCQYMKGYSSESGGKGNAAMVLIPGMEMFPSSSVTFPVSSLPSREPIMYYISITIKCEDSEGLQIDNSGLGKLTIYSFP